MEILQYFIDLLKDPRGALMGWIEALGPIWVYIPLFAVIFAETGFVVTPFLPGDSLLFTAGVFAHGGGLNIWVLLGILITAAILGDTTNYFIGREFGERMIASGRIKALKPEYIEKTSDFFHKHGGKSIILARFFPIIRTFAPFMAGVGHMCLTRFWSYNIVGGVIWVTLFTLLGYFFGGIPFVQDHFELVVIAIVVISVIPLMGGAVKSRMDKRKAGDTIGAEREM